MGLKTFCLSASVSTTVKPEAVRAVVLDMLGHAATIKPIPEGFAIETNAVVGVEARELNRKLFSALRRIDDAARLRADWTADGVSERFRGYVLVKERGS